MKITTKNRPFAPFSVEVEFETEVDLAAFYVLFNYAPIVDFLDKRGIDCKEIRSTLELAHGAAINYCGLHQRFHDHMKEEIRHV